ncbi:type I-E CRISPR-associated protein Cas5/CasD [Methylomonas sp. LW13]|uniref:type I-E CRISPR-associated protein Cas5/CasD n=1 Tax=unclassified Methylomonas TaxID=2608980 RepID=UPI00051C1A25|nr:type I-E CRISPR-associated protein Cas5/CasD [Methylomonas sp. LW13]QBC25852.1 type I-E CRISPR-associated protein Cas5/CasD [Methylomonas sp. LW13]
MDLLLFRLYGPMASWGEIAVGESRHSANYPSKSAILGLVGAALGIERSDEAQQASLQNGYQVAVEVFSTGQLLRDYHTAQVPDSAGKFVYRTRRDELVLGKERLGTILSSREYRSDALAVVALRALPDAPFSLIQIEEKLRKPVFHLYLGRKSCPLAAPLHPQLLTEQADLLSAFKAYLHKPLLPHKEADGALGQPDKQDAYWLNAGGERHYYWEGEPDDFAKDIDLQLRQTRVRHDQPLSRKRWQFAPRQEHYFYQGGE